jgi:hypothetical protein
MIFSTTIFTVCVAVLPANKGETRKIIKRTTIKIFFNKKPPKVMPNGHKLPAYGTSPEIVMFYGVFVIAL